MKTLLEMLAAFESCANPLFKLFIVRLAECRLILVRKVVWFGLNRGRVEYFNCEEAPLTAAIPLE